MFDDGGEQNKSLKKISHHVDIQTLWMNDDVEQWMCEQATICQRNILYQLKRWQRVQDLFLLPSSGQMQTQVKQLNYQIMCK